MDDGTLLLALLAACAATLYGLLAVWAALGRGYWCLRVAVVAAAVGSLIPVPAYDLAIVFLSQSLMILVPLSLVKAARSARGCTTSAGAGGSEQGRTSHRFSLVDMLLLTLVAAGIACLGVYLPEKHRDFCSSYVLIGIGAGTASLAATWAALGPGWKWLRWMVLIAVAPSVGLALRLLPAPEGITEALFSQSAVFPPVAPEWFAPAVMLAMSAMLALLLLVMQGALTPAFCQVGARNADAHKAQRLRPIAAIGLLSAISFLPAQAYFDMLCVPPRPNTVVPDPNGYLVLANLGSDVEQEALLMTATPGIKALRTVSAANRERLKEARQALQLPHRVPVNYSLIEINIDRLNGLRSLARAWRATGALDVAKDRLGEATTNYLDIMRLARVASQGGLVVESLVGAAIEGVGRDGLCRIRASLAPASCLQAIKTLHRLELAREEPAELLTRERIWQQHAYGWPVRISFIPQVGQSQATNQFNLGAAAKTRLLICDLALRLHLAQRGELPKRLEQLVPDYLPTLPLDPFTERPFIYRPNGSTFLLYSVGRDLQDDGGTPVPGGAISGNGDLTLGP